MPGMKRLSQACARPAQRREEEGEARWRAGRSCERRWVSVVARDIPMKSSDAPQSKPRAATEEEERLISSLVPASPPRRTSRARERGNAPSCAGVCRSTSLTPSSSPCVSPSSVACARAGGRRGQLCSTTSAPPRSTTRARTHRVVLVRRLGVVVSRLGLCLQRGLHRESAAVWCGANLAPASSSASRAR